LQQRLSEAPIIEIDEIQALTSFIADNLENGPRAAPHNGGSGEAGTFRLF